MKTYHETTGEELTSPDLTLGYTYLTKRFVQHHDEVVEVTERQLLPGTEAFNNGKGLYTIVVVTPAVPAYDEYEDCFYYHPYTDEELAEMYPPDPEPSDPIEIVSSWDEMAEAFKEGVNSVL